MELRLEPVEHRYHPSPCDFCGARVALCNLCTRLARHWVEDPDIPIQTLYLCNIHVSPYAVWAWISSPGNEHLFDEAVHDAVIVPDPMPEPEIAIYMPGEEGCPGCDTW